MEGDGFRFVRMQIYLLVCFFGWVLILENSHRGFTKVYVYVHVILVHDLDNLIVWKYGSTRLSMTSESIIYIIIIIT